jgi:acetyl esterase/lipase
VPAPADRQGGGVILYLHGGGMVVGGGELGRYWADLQMKMSGRRVIAVDFRNPPDHPYPAALDDCLAVYLEMLKTESPANIAVMGASGGGNLAIALVMRLVNGHHPLPAALALQSPEADVTEAGDSFRTMMGIDSQLTASLVTQSQLYAGGHNLADPEISPLHADFPTNFPPTWIQSGTRDLFLSNAVLLHRKLRQRGVEAELHIWEAMPHGGFGGTSPEERDMASELAHFMARHLPD